MKREFIKGITLLSKKEYIDNKDIIEPRIAFWWLRTPDYHRRDTVRIIDSCREVYNGFVDDPYNGVRPALIVDLPSDYKRGDKVKIAGYIWTVLSSKLIHCDDIITAMSFRREYEKPDANKYEKSDVKKWLDEWFSAEIN